MFSEDTGNTDGKLGYEADLLKIYFNAIEGLSPFSPHCHKIAEKGLESQLLKLLEISYFANLRALLFSYELCVYSTGDESSRENRPQHTVYQVPL